MKKVLFILLLAVTFFGNARGQDDVVTAYGEIVERYYSFFGTSGYEYYLKGSVFYLDEIRPDYITWEDHLRRYPKGTTKKRFDARDRVIKKVRKEGLDDLILPYAIHFIYDCDGKVVGLHIKTHYQVDLTNPVMAKKMSHVLHSLDHFYFPSLVKEYIRRFEKTKGRAQCEAYGRRFVSDRTFMVINKEFSLHPTRPEELIKLED